MALKAKHKDVEFGIGDRIRVEQIVKEDKKERTQVFDGMVIAIKGRENNQTFTVRKIGVQQVGIERIYPIKSPLIKEIEIVRQGVSGVRHAKLYYTREKSKKEIEKIYTRATKRKEAKTKDDQKRVSKVKKHTSSKKKNAPKKKR